MGDTVKEEDVKESGDELENSEESKAEELEIAEYYEEEEEEEIVHFKASPLYQQTSAVVLNSLNQKNGFKAMEHLALPIAQNLHAMERNLKKKKKSKKKKRGDLFEYEDLSLDEV